MIDYSIEEVFPEEMEWVDQITLFANAKFVAGEFGSGIHNTVFSSSETKCLVIKPSYSNLIQSGIAASREQLIAYLFPKKETRVSQTHSVYEVCTEKLREYLELILD